MTSSLWGRMGLLFLAFFLLVSISAAATFWIIDTQNQDALVINLAGRQRMLVEQMAKDALQIQAYRSVDLIGQMQARADTFDQTLRALMNGGPAPYSSGQTVNLPATRQPDTLAGLNQVQRTWEAFRPYLNVIAAEEPRSPGFDAAMRAIENLSPNLVQQSDDVVRMYESASAQKVSRLRGIQIAFFASALVLLAAGFVVVQNSVIRPLHTLGLIAERIGEGGLDAAVQVPGPREIRALAGSLDAMRTQLRDARDDLEARVNRRTRELTALHDVSREISSRLEIDQVLRSVTDKTRELLDSEVAFLCLIDESAQSLNLEAFSGPEGAVAAQRTSAQRSPASVVLAGESALACGVEGCQEFCGIIAPTFRTSHLAAPLRAGERVIGALCVGRSGPEAFDSEETGLLTKLANSAAIALENARLYRQAERAAMLEERQRIAGEMHDGLAQTLAYLELRTEQALHLMQGGRTEEAISALHDLHRAFRQAGQEVRRAIANLKDDTLRRQSLQERLAAVVKTATKEGGPPVEFVTRLEPPLLLPSDEAEQVTRVVQEALLNACHHAEAARVTVCLERQGDTVRVTVEDDGQGFDPAATPLDGRNHFGLSIMRARAARIGGELVIHSQKGRGTSVVLSWSAGRADERAAERSIAN